MSEEEVRDGSDYFLNKSQFSWNRLSITMYYSSLLTQYNKLYFQQIEQY